MKISTSKKRITPEGKFFPCYLMGHAIRTEIAKGIADELYTEALVLKVNDETLVFASFDLIGMDKEYSDDIKNYVYEKYGVPTCNTNVGFVHTHSAPEYSNISFFGEPKAIDGYMDYVADQIKSAIDECFNAEFVEVKAYYKNTLIDGYYSNRNGLDKIGDNNITIITFENDNVVVGAMFNITCHSTVLGPQNLFVSSDLAGYLNRELQIRYGVAPVTMIGAAGDMSNRQLRQGNDYRELKRVGDGIMAQIDANEQHDELIIDSVMVKEYTYARTFTTTKEDREAAVKAIEDKLATAKNYDETKVYTSALSGAKAKLNQLVSDFNCQCTLYKLGDLFILSIPAELFSCFGLQIKAEMQVKCPIVWGYSNYSVGYLADEAEYGTSFETASSDIPKGTTEEIVQGIIDTIKSM